MIYTILAVVALAAVLILAAALAGLDEGMDMEADGVRESWMFKVYHRISGFGRIFIWLNGLLVGYLKLFSPLQLLLYAFIAWDVFEYGYSYARYRKLINNDVPEHINWFDIVSFHAPSKVLHIIRFALIIALGVICIYL